MLQPPAFIAFTGVDSPALIPRLQALSSRYPIEWGILIDDARGDELLFPDAADRAALLAAPGLRFAAHVCGEQARLIADDPDGATLDLTGFQRLQVNHGFSGSSGEQVENCVRFGRSRGLRTMLQAVGEFPAEPRLDWLFDTSFGTGKPPAAWPALPPAGPFCGFSGGIGPANAAQVIQSIGAAQGEQYWIDMESGIRTDGALDLAKCAAVCEAVYGGA
ncbi:beta/alpha barrel domain-containing protein [Novosphingobium aquimarinum]|uniref:phosphoribosylanthranilate isomerase n=1 Tax=Novosphingobium aquimarinum TaxID=2682494 RepID=UPI0012ECB623|nr:phosphoribosylanthranilate isomerase [Novosphingobium aquimarinum]